MPTPPPTPGQKWVRGWWRRRSEALSAIKSYGYVQEGITTVASAWSTRSFGKEGAEQASESGRQRQKKYWKGEEETHLRDLPNLSRTKLPKPRKLPDKTSHL